VTPAELVASCLRRDYAYRVPTIENMRGWLRALVDRGWLVEHAPDDFRITDAGRRHLQSLDDDRVGETA
jgi:hypothetical protein